MHCVLFTMSGDAGFEDVRKGKSHSWIACHGIRTLPKTLSPQLVFFLFVLNHSPPTARMSGERCQIMSPLHFLALTFTDSGSLIAVITITEEQISSRMQIKSVNDCSLFHYL